MSRLDRTNSREPGSHTTLMRRPSVMRSGLSIMEVLFAIAVLTIGMLGVASILPVATNNASMALQTDRAVEEISNRVAMEVAKLEDNFQEVKVGYNSLAQFNLNTSPRQGQRYANVSTTQFGNHIAAYETHPSATAASQPLLPDAFCIDPWFLTAASTLRDDESDPLTSRNGYDRTMFPCYDPRLDPLNVSPTDNLGQSVSAGLIKTIDLPRFTRVALTLTGSSLLAANDAEYQARRSDDFSIVVPDDRTRPPGLFVQRGGNGVFSPAQNKVSSRFSSMITMARSAPGSNLFNAAVVTMLDRNIVTVPGGYFNGHVASAAAGSIPAHNMRPYTAWLPDDPARPNSFPQDENLIYPGEMLGYVAKAPRPISGGGGGEFVFRTNRYVRPSISDGDWLMLMRRDYIRNPGTGAITPSTLKYAWYRVSDVIRPPTVVNIAGTEYYESQVAVRGQDWLFHPIQQQVFSQYGPPYFGNAIQPTWGTPPAFDFDAMPAQGVNPLGYNHFDYGTVVVLMPDVVSVRQFQVQL